MQQHVEQLLTHPKASAVAVSATVASGWANWFEFFNANLTLAATITGILLSWTMIYMHVKKMRREDAEHRLMMKKINAEIDILVKQR
jgi:hypothetical protein